MYNSNVLATANSPLPHFYGFEKVFGKTSDTFNGRAQFYFPSHGLSHGHIFYH